MKTVRIETAFTGYPAGRKTHFAQGEEPELSNDYADLIVGKGHAKHLKPAPPAKAETKEAVRETE